MNLKKIGKVLTSKSVGTGPWSYEKGIYRAAVSHRLRNIAIWSLQLAKMSHLEQQSMISSFSRISSVNLFVFGIRFLYILICIFLVHKCTNMFMSKLIINTYVSLMYELKENGKVFTSKSVGTGPSSYEKRIYRAAVSRRQRNTSIWSLQLAKMFHLEQQSIISCFSRFPLLIYSFLE